VGAEGGNCFPNGSCESGLSCLSKLCVYDPEADAGPTVGLQLLTLVLFGCTAIQDGNVAGERTRALPLERHLQRRAHVSE
jgi:hypothetical protein